MSGDGRTSNFTTWDYAIVVATLSLTAAVGVYHIWRSRKSQNTKQFLLVNRNLGLWPLVMSAAATALTSGNLLGTPMQGYANGVQMMTGYVGFFSGLVITAYTTMPVLYGLNVDTVNQYIEYRFNRFLRIFPAFVLLVMQSFIAAGITYVTALVLTQATNIHINSSIALLGGLCIAYSSFGGFTAVIWTDVFQMAIIFATYALLASKGTVDSGGFEDIWTKNELGNRTTFAHFSPVPHSGYTIWSLIIGEFTLSFCVISGSQMNLQRQLSNRTIGGARKTILLGAAITEMLSIVSVWIGMAAYARYFRCDPVLTGKIQSKDQIVAQFALDMFLGIPGLYGLYVAGILCATLSTLSSLINSFSAIILVDFIKPIMSERTDESLTRMSKFIGMFYGLSIMALSTVSKYFGSLIAIMHAIGGSAIGTGTGIYVLAFFFPWATAKGTTVGYFISLVFGWWLSIGRLLIGNPYIMAPVSADGCNITAPSGSHLYNESFNNGSSYDSSTPEVASTSQDSSSWLPFFPLRDVIPIWYALFTLCVTVVVGMLASIIMGSNDLDKLNPKFISPVTVKVLRMLPRALQKRLGLVRFLSVATSEDVNDRMTETGTELSERVLQTES